MRAPWHEVDNIKLLCRKMIKRCDEYQAIKDSPERKSKAEEVKEEIIRLYAAIAMLQAK